MAVYATAQQLIARYDARTVGDLASDNDDQVSVFEIPTDPVIAVALEDASGLIEAALSVGGRYTASDLEGLTGNSLSHLIRVCCDIAMANLYARRPGYNLEKVDKFQQIADKHLERLRTGENIFNLEDHREAGTPSVGGPSTVDYQNLNLIRDRVSNYYPPRRLPNNR